MDSLLDPFRSDRKPEGRRDRRRRRQRRSRSLRATIAAITAGAMLAIGLPTMAFAAGDAATDAPTATSAESASGDEAATATEAATPSTDEAPASETPPAEAPAETEPPAPTEQPAVEEPVDDEAPSTEPPAETGVDPPTEQRAPAAIAPMAVFPADTANCTSNCANLTMTNVVIGGGATPASWTLRAVRSDNLDNFDFTSGQTRPVPRNEEYTLFAEGGPAGYTTTFACTTSSQQVDVDIADRTVEFPNNNGGGGTPRSASCTFTHTFVEPATITVQVGGDRTGPTSVSGLAGVQLELRADDDGTPGALIGQPWSICVSNASGVCTFTIPTPDDSSYWVVQRTAPDDAPAGWFSNDSLAIGSSPNSQPYRFVTPEVGSGDDLTSTADFMLASGNSNNQASGGIWQNSRTNPVAPQQCGIDVALIIDLSGSVAPYEAQLKNAAKDFVDALTGTPSQIGIYTFNDVAPASAGGNLPITPVSTAAGADVVKDHIDGFDTPEEATNWDRGISQVAASGVDYDLAVILTDGNPTVYANDEGPGNRTRFREVENGVFSANAVKSLGIRMVAVGVGDGIDGAPDNLVAISGPNAGSDYFQTEDYEAAGETLRQLALGDCVGSVSVVKQVVDEGTTGEDKTGETPSGGWEFTVDSNDPDVTPATQAGATADGTGAVNFPLEFADAATTGSVTVTETQQAGYSVVTTAGKNAVCTEVESGDAVTVVNDGANGFTIDVDPQIAVTCTVWNRPPEPQADLRVDKTWIVNGQTFANGNQPVGLTAQLGLDGANTPFGVVQTGFSSGDEVQISETTGVGNRDLCTVTSSKVTLANGAPANESLPYTPTLAPGSNSYTITNVVDCTAELTLVKSVANGDAQPGDWTLDAVAPGGALAGPNGTSGVSAAVTPTVRYPLVETGDPRYVQTILQGGIPVPPSLGSWNCVQTDAQGNVIPGFADGINGGVTVPLGFRVRCTAVNQTASLTLIKNVDNDLDIDADPSDWTLTATPNAPAVPGLGAQDATTGETVFVRPDTTYTISESGGPDGWAQTGIMCRTTPNGQYVETDQITLPALGQGTCVIFNDPIAPTLELTKIVTGDVAPANEWTLNASRADDDQVVASGDGTTGVVTVPAGVAFELSETTDLPNADQFGPGAWLCSLNGGPNVPGPNVAALGAGDAVECTVTNTLKPFTPSITKTAAVPTPNADGSWTIAYDIVVTNPSAFQPLDYILSDQLDFGSEVTVNSASYQRVQPLPAGAVEDWTVAFDAVQPFDDEPLLAAGTSHTWRVTVNATVDADADFTGTTQGACDDQEPGTVGFLNTATMYVGQVPFEASDCELPVKPTIAKQGGTAVDNGDGTWTLPYTITVTNPSATTSVVYDLVDELDLPASAEQVGVATVTSAPAGVVPEAGWTGHAPDTVLADDIALAGTAALDQHVYQVSVTVKLGADDGAFRCPSDGGLNNTATVDSGNQESDATGCVTVTPPTIAIEKQVVADSVVQDVDGRWSIAYDLVVTNTGAVGGAYSLADALKFGAGVDLSGASYAIEKDGSPFPSAWAGSGTIASDVYLAAGDPDPTHTYRITVTGIALDGPSLTDAQTLCPQDDANGAFNNLATLTVGGAKLTDTACAAPSAPQIAKTGATAVQNDDASWDVTYTLTVTNTAPGAKSSYYSLADAPGFPASVTINSYSASEVSPNPGDLAVDVTPVPASIVLVTDTAIGAGETHVYSITFNATVPTGLPAAQRECVTGQAGVGFFNEAQLTSGEIVREDDDCTPVKEGGRPTMTKSDPTLTQAADGTWTAVYEISVTGNPDFVSTYTLEDTLHFAGAIDIVSAEWAGEGQSGDWADPESNPTETIVGPAAKPIAKGAEHTYTVTVEATVDETAFADPATTSCEPSDQQPNVGFLNTATLTSDGARQSDDGCGVPARPEVTKTADDDGAVKAGDHWEVGYTITVENLSPTQALVYDLSDEPDFAGGVTITDREVTSAEVTVNPAWNGASPSTDVIALDQALAGGTTHTFEVVISFTVDADAEGPALRCEGDGGKGLVNEATVTSGGTWTDDDCVDVPVIVILDKEWVIDGGEPIAWDGDELPEGFTAQGVLDGDAVEWGAENGPYAVGDQVAVDESDVVVPAGCEIVVADANGTGDHTLDAAVNTFLVTNEVECEQTVTLEKIVTNEHGGDAVASDWTLSGTNVGDDADAFQGEGTASGSVELGVGYTLNEVSAIWADGVEYEVAATWSCSSEQGEDAFTLVPVEGATSATLTVHELGATVDCEIENTDLAPTLTLVKDVAPDSVEGEFPPTLWTVSATEDGEAAIVTGAGTATGAVDSNVDYVLAELASDFEGADEFEAGAWSCDVPGVLTGDTANLDPGDDVTCTIVNTAKPAAYTLDKEVAGVVQNDDGTWTIDYTVTVTNESIVSPVTYDLEDSLEDFGEGIEIDEATWEGPGDTAGEWEDPATEPVEELANDVVLTPAVGEHEYFVTVKATVTGDAVWDEGDGEGDGSTGCVPDEQGGFANSATLTVAGLPTDDEACAEPGRTTAVKVAHPATDLGGGDFEIVYEITVDTVGDHDLVYDLGDTLVFPDGVTIDSATATDPDGGEVAGWNGADATTLATAHPITAGDTHVWTITVRANAASIETIDHAKCEATETRGGFLNTAEMVNGTVTTELEGCTDIPIVDVGIVKTAVLPEGVDAVEAGTVDNTFDWVLTVTNNGPTPVEGVVVTDTLPDSLEFDPAAIVLDPIGSWTFLQNGSELTWTTDATFGPGPIVEITIPVTLKDPVVGPELPENPSEEPPLVPAEDIENTACVAVSEFDVDEANDCDTAEVPTKAMQANAFVQCENDVPYLHYDVQTTGSVAPGPITVTWTPDASVYPDVEPIVTEIPWDDRDGRTLWPYGVVNDEGISIGWPGWRLIQEGDVVGENGIVDIWENMVKDSKLESYAFADRVNPMTITFQVNPSESVLAVYPMATPACAVERDPSVTIEKTSSVTEAKPGSSFDYTLSVTNSGLGAVEAVELFDEIPGALKVDTITTDAAPAFPRWDDCEVTGKDSSGYGGTLHCVLNGMIGGIEPDAPDVVLGVTLNPASKKSSIDNTGEVCWNDLPDQGGIDGEPEPGIAPLVAIDPELPVLCDDSTVPVRVLQPPAPGIASTGFAGGPFLWGAAGLLLVGALLVSVTIVRRRRPGERHAE